ncbi:hypothetical protein GEMRC1_007283 [Eukaryota sp. GEM-RC1]
MVKPKLTFVTGNPNKLREVREILGDHFEVVHDTTDLPEYQGSCPEEITFEKCKEAAKTVPTPFIVEDVCLCFSAYKGLPGPYIKWFLGAIGREGLCKMLSGFEDKSAWAQCTFAYLESPEKDPILFVGKTDGQIVSPFW